MSPAQRTPHGGSQPDRPFSTRYLRPLLLGSTLNPINSSMIATGLAGIGAEFHLGPGQTASLISVLYLFSSVMQPTMGKLASLFGPRRVLIAWIIILLAAGFVGAFAPSFGFLLVVFGARATDPGFHALAWVLAGIGAAVLLMALADRRIPSVAA